MNPNNTSRASWLHDGYFNAYYPCPKDEFDSENFEFTAELKFKRFIRGMSSCKAVYVDCHGLEYEMFVSNLEKMIHSVENIKSVSGVWTFCKKGMNVGIVLIKPL